MTVTILVPDWIQLMEMRTSPPILHGQVPSEPEKVMRKLYELEFDKSQGCEVVTIRERISVVPMPIMFVPYKMFIMRHVSPMTTAKNGSYSDPSGVEALVEQAVNHGTLVQSFVARSKDLGLLYEWFGGLMAGKMNDYCTYETPLADQPVGLQVLEAIEQARRIVRARLDHSIVGTRSEEFLDDYERLFAILHGRERWGSTQSANVDLEEARRIVLELLGSETLTDFTRSRVQALAVILGAEMSED